MSDVEFDIRFGQELCDVFASELGLTCSFMGDEGRIVASSARERVGSIHAIAARIMKGEMDEYAVSAEEAARSAGMREGINMAIDYEGHRL
ncbi:MAG: chemotaxis protein, partial [Magnetospirillum sp.]|nr:chemotaxis protein [Magnetospirillum sp.]